jgi:hypothetical protein
MPRTKKTVSTTIDDDMSDKIKSIARDKYVTESTIVYSAINFALRHSEFLDSIVPRQRGRPSIGVALSTRNIKMINRLVENGYTLSQLMSMTETDIDQLVSSIDILSEA